MKTYNCHGMPCIIHGSSRRHLGSEFEDHHVGKTIKKGKDGRSRFLNAIETGKWPLQIYENEALKKKKKKKVQQPCFIKDFQYIYFNNLLYNVIIES